MPSLPRPTSGCWTPAGAKAGPPGETARVALFTILGARHVIGWSDRRRDRPRKVLLCIAGVADVLVGGAIRGGLQAHPHYRSHWRSSYRHRRPRCCWIGRATAARRHYSLLGKRPTSMPLDDSAARPDPDGPRTAAFQRSSSERRRTNPCRPFQQSGRRIWRCSSAGEAGARLLACRHRLSWR